MKSDEYLDPFRPAKEVYLLLDVPPLFISSIYLNVLFLPSRNTLGRLKIVRPIASDFDTAYHEWIISKNIYVDQYGFIVPIGKYHPKLVDSEELRIDEEEDEEEFKKKEIRASKTPEKRVRNAIGCVHSLREYNHELQDNNSYRPDYEEILYHFRQMQMYLNNEAKAKANQMRQEYCWNDYLMKVTEHVHDMSVDRSDIDEFDDEKTQSRGHMFSVANRANWKGESWQNVDIQALCRLGISSNLRSRVWFDLLEVYKIEDITMGNFRRLEEYDKTLSPYENLKVLTIQHYNVAFAQIDEDMKTLNITNTPSRDDRGKIKNILKCYLLWQKI